MKDNVIIVNSNGLGTQSPYQAILLREKHKIFNQYIKGREYYFLDLFADTGDETEHTYNFKQQYENYVSDPPLITISRGKLYGTNQTLMQEYTEKGIIPTRKFRHCTDKFKIRVVRKYLRGFMDMVDLQRKNTDIYMMIGFTIDEIGRMRDSDVKYIKNIFPLIDLKMDREDVIYEMNKRYLYPEKSGCYFCPFLTPKRYMEYIKDRPLIEIKVITMELRARSNNPKMVLFGKPIEQVKEDYILDGLEECDSGYCFT